MKQNTFIYTIFTIVCSLFIVSSCSQEENIENALQPKEFIINITDAGIHNAKNTRATEFGYTTTFQHGDKIGLFAVKDGQIVNDINNVCLSCYIMPTSTAWIPENKTLPYDEKLEGATYYAYYPYDETLATSFKANDSTDPFIDIVKNWTIGENQAGEYTKYDLMTGSAQAVLDGKNYTLNLKLNHRMAMVEIQLPSTTYNFTNTDQTIEPYSIPAANPTFTLAKGENEAIEIQPYYEAVTDKYRLLLNPETAYTVAGKFTSSENRNYAINITGIQAGTYAPYTIDGGTQKIDHELKIGDFYCSNGFLVAANEVENSEYKDKIIGIVYQIGTTDAIKADYPNCNHALVHALKRSEFTDQRWGTVSKHPSNPKWFEESFTIPKTATINGVKTIDRSSLETAMMGYEETKVWLNLTEVTLNEILKANLEGYTVKAPGFTTNWYVPSMREMLIIAENKTTLNEELTKVGGEVLWKDATWEALQKGIGYWTTTVRSDALLWLYTDCGDEEEQKNYLTYQVKEGTRGYYRFSLAF